MTLASSYLLMITLKVHGLNPSIKRHKVDKYNWKKEKQDPIIYCLQEVHCSFKEIHRLKAKGEKNMFQANGNQKQAEVKIIDTDIIDFKSKTVTVNN